MRNDDGCRSILYGSAENLSGMYQTLVNCADTDNVSIDDSVGTIKGDSEEMFPVEMTVGFEIFVNGSGIGDDRITLDTVVAGALLSNFASAISLSYRLHLTPPVPNEAI